jgi:hypothetical protein
MKQTTSANSVRTTRYIQRNNDRRFEPDWAGDVYVWDIDKTYLDTRFSSLRGLLAIPFELAVDKRALGGTVPLLRALRVGPNVAAPAFAPLYFVSGSPPNLRGVIEQKMMLDGVQPDGIAFKDQFKLLRSGRPRAIKEQVGYKVAALLLLRSELPAGARFHLFGDDVESDMEAFLVFGLVCAGLRGAPLRETLRGHGTAWQEIETIVELASPLPVEPDPVVRVFIHGQTGKLLPRTDLDPRVVATRAFLQTALVLRQHGHVDDGCPDRVADDLRRLGVGDAELELLRTDARVRLGVTHTAHGNS